MSKNLKSVLFIALIATLATVGHSALLTGRAFVVETRLQNALNTLTGPGITVVGGCARLVTEGADIQSWSGYVCDVTTPSDGAAALLPLSDEVLAKPLIQSLIDHVSSSPGALTPEPKEPTIRF